MVVVIFHDHGSRYVGKIFNDDWMRDRGFLEDKTTAADLVKRHGNKNLVTIDKGDLVKAAIEKMTAYNISQLPVKENGSFVGSLDERTIFKQLKDNPGLGNELVSSIMSDPFPVMDGSVGVEDISKSINKDVQAVLIDQGKEGMHIVTMHDLIDAMK